MTRTHPINQIETGVIVGIGGFAGSNLRYFVETVVPSSLLATATVNIVGCIALGLVLYEELYEDTLSQPARTLLATGFIASFTTYSTFIIDALTTTPLLAVGYLIGSYALGFWGVLIGRAGARRVTAAYHPPSEDRD